jgi:hypothetical protein
MKEVKLYDFICLFLPLNMSSNSLLLLMFNRRNRQMNYYVIKFNFFHTGNEIISFCLKIFTI